MLNGIYKSLITQYHLPINLGNPKEYTILEVIDIIKTLVESKSVIKFYDLPENDPKRRQPNIDLAKKLLNWEPKINLREGLNLTIEYFKNLK